MNLRSFLFPSLFILLTFNAAKAQDNVAIHRLLDEWHKAAGEANATKFFGAIAEDGIYIGTDVHERWTKAEFLAFAKPYFDRGSAWDFKPRDRDLHVSKDGRHAWFSELLDTWMGVCRGSGMLRKTKDGWAITQYHLSVTVPNDIVRDFIKLVDEYHKVKAK